MADALAQARGRAVSTLLLARNTRRMRATIAAFAGTVEARYAARSAKAFAALSTAAPWPGAALLWCDVGHGLARLKASPPRGITIGR